MKYHPSLASLLRNLTLCACLLCPASLLLLPATSRADDTNIVQKTKTALADAGDATKTALANAGDEAKAGLDDLKDRAMDSSPNNYTAGELAALVLIGLAVSAIAGNTGGEAGVGVQAKRRRRVTGSLGVERTVSSRVARDARDRYLLSVVQTIGSRRYDDRRCIRCAGHG